MIDRTNRTFTLEDVNEELFQRVVFVDYCRNSGLGGRGAIEFLTENGEEYFFSFRNERIESILKEITPFLKKDFNHHNNITDYGWKYIYEGYGTELFIRDDFAETFFSTYNQYRLSNKMCIGIILACELLNAKPKN